MLNVRNSAAESCSLYDSLNDDVVCFYRLLWLMSLPGSIGIPAAWNVFYGFKPTGWRIPYGDQQLITDPGLKILPACAGPMGNDIEALEIFCRAVVDARPVRLDAMAYNVPWRRVDKPQNRKLRVGLLPENPLFPLHSSMKKVMAETVHKLEAQGHTILRLKTEECAIGAASEIIWSLAAVDNEAVEKTAIEPVIRSRIVMADSVASFEKSALPDISQKSQIKKLSFLNLKNGRVPRFLAEIMDQA